MAFEEIEENGLIAWNTVQIHDADFLQTTPAPVAWVDPTHRLEALKFVQQLMVDYHSFGNVVELLEESPDPEMARKQSLNAMFTYADYVVQYIAKGEKIPLIGTIGV